MIKQSKQLSLKNPSGDESIFDMSKDERSKILIKIAKDMLGIKVIEARNSDGFDFYDPGDSIAIGDLKDALQKAYNAGWLSAMKSACRNNPSSDAVLLGTTTLQFMLNAAYDENNPLYARTTYGECGGAWLRVKADPSAGNETVYAYYHRKDNTTIMTNIEGDTVGAIGSSAGFRGKVKL